MENKNILTFETYGKTFLPKRIILDVRERFRVNPIIEKMFKNKGIGCYVPKLKRGRFTLSVIGAVVCIVAPFITPLSVPILLWGIRK